MNPPERASHPSVAQIRCLLNFLEKNPRLIKGFPKVPSLKDAARKTWEKQAVQLNSLQGCFKTWKQWTKYWADKKSAVKKKALKYQIYQTNKADGNTDVVELSENDERILTLMGGESFTIGDKNEFSEGQAEESSECLSIPQPTQLTCKNEMPRQQTEQHSTPITLQDLAYTKIPIVEASQKRQHYLYIPRTSAQSSEPSMISPNRSDPPNPSDSDGHPILRNTRQQSPTTNTAPRRRHQRHSTPPLQWRTQLTNMMKRSLAVEEQRITLDRRNSQILEILVKHTVERDCALNHALHSIGKGLQLIAEAIKK